MKTLTYLFKSLWSPSGASGKAAKGIPSFAIEGFGRCRRAADSLGRGGLIELSASAETTARQQCAAHGLG